MKRAPSLGVLLVLLTAGISGVSAFVNAYAVQGVNSDAFLTVRNVLVAGMLVPLAFLATREVRRRLRREDWFRLALIGLVGGAIPFLLFFRGLQMAAGAGAATASFGYRTLFLMAAVFALVYLKERVSWRLAGAAVLLLAGNVLLLSLTAPVWTDGTALVLMATALWAGEYALSKRALRDLPSTTVALGRVGFGAVFLLAWLAASGQLGDAAALTGPQLQWVGISALLLAAFVSTWYAGLKHVDLSVAAALLSLAFPVTWVLGALAGRVTLQLPQAVGAVAVVFGASLAVGLASLRESWIHLVQQAARGLRRVSGSRRA